MMNPGSRPPPPINLGLDLLSSSKNWGGMTWLWLTIPGDDMNLVKHSAMSLFTFLF